MSEPTRWISAETERKERDFHGILWTHATMCKGIMTRWNAPPYLYVDLYAGPGRLEYDGLGFDGSPLIARDILSSIGRRYHAVHFEQDPEVAARLADALWVPTSLLDVPNADNSPIIVGKCQDEFPRWLDRNGYEPNRFGLVYADPINDEIPFEMLNKAAKMLPRVDLLSYVSATQYKRRRGVDPGRPYLSEHIAAVEKKVALIREKGGPWQFTFVLWTNWTDYPEWQKRGFYRLDSEHGQRIIEQLDLSARESHARANAPLWTEDASA